MRCAHAVVAPSAPLRRSCRPSVPDCSGSADLVADGSTGYLVAPGDIAGLRAVLQDLVDHPQQLNQRKAALEASSLPAVDAEADTYLAMYAEVLRRNKRDGILARTCLT